MLICFYYHFKSDELLVSRTPLNVRSPTSSNVCDVQGIFYNCNVGQQDSALRVSACYSNANPFSLKTLDDDGEKLRNLALETAFTALHMRT